MEKIRFLQCLSKQYPTIDSLIVRPLKSVIPMGFLSYSQTINSKYIHRA